MEVLKCTIDSTLWYGDNSLTDEAHGERSKQSIKEKCQQYLERAEALLVMGKRKLHSIAGSTSQETKLGNPGSNPVSGRKQSTCLRSR
ncbi:hypothetical protein EMCRGX_G016496 [Ephydatia muelleri]